MYLGFENDLVKLYCEIDLEKLAVAWTVFKNSLKPERKLHRSKCENSVLPNSVFEIID